MPLPAHPRERQRFAKVRIFPRPPKNIGFFFARATRRRKKSCTAWNFPHEFIYFCRR